MADVATTISEVTGRGMIELRLRPLSAANQGAAKKALGVDLPAKPRTSAASGERTVLWLSPDHWLITCPAAETAALVKALETGLQGLSAAIVDVSDARRVFAVSGGHARLVLMKGMSVDLMHEDVTPGFVRRARFADLATLIHCTGSDPDSFHLYVFRSYFDYVQRWLEQTSAPAGLFDLYGAQPAPTV